MAQPQVRQAASPCPPWQVFKGYKMKVARKDIPRGIIKIKGSAAKLTISPTDRDWTVRWNIEHGGSGVGGYVRMDDDMLRRAFGLKDGLGIFGQAVAARAGTPVDAAEQGCFVRWGRFLNIHHPGIGLQGDPNISIELDDEMKTAVTDLLQHYPRMK